MRRKYPCTKFRNFHQYNNIKISCHISTSINISTQYLKYNTLYMIEYLYHVIIITGSIFRDIGCLSKKDLYPEMLIMLLFKYGSPLGEALSHVLMQCILSNYIELPDFWSKRILWSISVISSQVYIHWCQYSSTSKADHYTYVVREAKMLIFHAKISKPHEEYFPSS
jgi:hypothetical protein